MLLLWPLPGEVHGAGRDRAEALGPARPRSGVGVRLAASVLVIVLAGWLAVTNAIAAFEPATSSAGHRPDASAPALESSRGGSAVLLLPDGAPGDDATSYVEVRAGSAPAAVRLFGATEGTGLDRYLRLTVTRGSGRGSAFVPDAPDHLGVGPGVLYRGSLAEFPDDLRSAIADPGGAWADGEAHTYRFHVRLRGGNAAQGLTASQSFRWAAVAA